MTRALVMAAAALLISAATASAQNQPPAPAAPAAQATVGPNYVDNDGDGICDLRQARANRGAAQRAGRGGYGPGDGTGNAHVGPRDGTGYGRGPSAGGGTCDGTGPKGRMMRRGGGR
jgi:hypothetical protein